jgi:hypothetical protein
MKNQIFSLCSILLLPFVCYGNSLQENSISADQDEKQAENVSATGSSRDDKNANPSRSYTVQDKDPQGYAYLGSQEDYQHDQEQYIANSDENTSKNQSSKSKGPPRSNPRWYRDRNARRAYLRGDEDYRRVREPSESSGRK